MAANLAVPPKAGDFLAQAGWQGARIELLAADASFRRYFRVFHGDRVAVLMDAPPPHEDPQPFLEIARYLRSSGLHAPEILAQDLSSGLVLIEDFGDVRMREFVEANPAEERKIYRRAIDTLVDLHRHLPAEVAQYTEQEYLREARLFTDWFCPAQGLDVDTAGFERAWSSALDTVTVPPKEVTVLRDYHAENIMLLDEKGQGLLDFQDALVGHPAYDLVSLLQDARRDVSVGLESEMLDYYLAKADGFERFRSDYMVLGAQRNAKIIGIFVRLAKRDGKDRYLGMIPRVWAALERDLESPQLEPVRSWFDRNIPDDMRGPQAIMRGQ